MRRRATIAVLAGVWLLSARAPAEANWGWLEKLSGPGPFAAQLPGLNFPLVCIREDYSRDLFFCDEGARGRPRGHVSLEFQRWESRENGLFPADPRGALGEVRILDFRPNLMIRLHDAVDVGVGAGFHRFSGPAFDAFFKMSVEPMRVSLAPFVLFGDADWLRIAKIEVGVTRFLGEFTNEDFCSPPACSIALTRPFSAEGELLWRSTFVLDFSALVW